MRIWFLGAVSVLSFCRLCVGQNESLKSETIEMREVLFSNCLTSSQKTEREDIWPVQVVDVRIEKIGGKVRGQFQESDEACKSEFSKSFDWTADQFESAKTRLKKAGMQDGTFAWAESSGSELPVSYLKIQSADLKGGIYTMYLRFRWSGKMSTDNVLDEWRSILRGVAQQVSFKF
jgi:hypothetical protein